MNVRSTNIKIYLLVLCIMFSSIPLVSQGYFPLQKGNIWQYYSASPMYPETWQAKIVGDTLLPNGKTYAIHTGLMLGSGYLRQENSKVFGYDSKDSAEYVLFDFNAKVQDTISIHSKHKRTIVLKSIIAVQPNYQWVFIEYYGDSLYSYDFYNWTITDSIGLTYVIVEPGNSYRLIGSRINGIINGTITNVENRIERFPREISLAQNYPNPFNPATYISFSLSSQSFVALKVFDPLGREVVTLVSEELPAGKHICQWNAANTSSGVYFYRLQVGTVVETKKLILMK